MKLLQTTGKDKFRNPTSFINKSVFPNNPNKLYFNTFQLQHNKTVHVNKTC